MSKYKTPGEELVDVFNQLRLRLNQSGVERTVGLREAFDDDCAYYRKSLDKFLKQDYVDLRNLTKKITDLLKVIEHE